jgi:phosphate transport system substrate-binding protein
MRRVLQDLTEAYRRQHPNVLFVVRSGGSTLGEVSVTRGDLDLAASTLFPPETETETPAPGTAPVVRTPIGIDGLALIVHASNPIDALTLVQLRDIFSGSVLDWQALGSDAGEILLISREDGSGARVRFEERVMDGARVALTAVVMPTSASVVEFVGKNPHAIGYVSRAEVAELIDEEEGIDDTTTEPGAPAANLPPVKVLSVEGLLPTIATLRSQQYALTQPLYLVSAGPPTGVVRDFLDFALSPTGQGIVGRYHAAIRE